MYIYCPQTNSMRTKTKTKTKRGVILIRNLIEQRKRFVVSPSKVAKEGPEKVWTVDSPSHVSGESVGNESTLRRENGWGKVLHRLTGHVLTDKLHRTHETDRTVHNRFKSHWPSLRNMVWTGVKSHNRWKLHLIDDTTSIKIKERDPYDLW